jgi:glycosyltransferase involved in cell wall biosynthesis
VGGKLHEQLKAKAPLQNFTALPNGYDADLMHATSGKPPKEVFHIVFTGLLTENQDYKTFLEVLNRFSESYKIRFSLAGNIDPHIIATIKNTSPNIEVQHLGYLSHQKAIAFMKQAHLLLNFIFKGAQTQMISGKLLEYMATEVPILSIGNPQSEAGRFLMQGSAAEMIEAHQLKEIERLLERTIKGKGNLKNKFPGIENWSRQALTKRLEGIINEVY